MALANQKVSGLMGLLRKGLGNRRQQPAPQKKLQQGAVPLSQKSPLQKPPEPGVQAQSAVGKGGALGLLSEKLVTGTSKKKLKDAQPQKSLTAQALDQKGGPSGPTGY